MIEKESASYLRNRGDLIWTHYWSVWVMGPAVGCCHCVLLLLRLCRRSRSIVAVAAVVVVAS